MSSVDFGNRVQDTVVKGFVAAGISLGTKLGLFDGLAALSQSKDTAVTTEVLADKLKLKERYVREWINGMVCADVVDHVEDGGVNKYWLAPYRVATLTHTPDGCPAMASQLFTGAANNYRKVEECFPVEGSPGTEVDDYPGLHEFLATKSSPLKDVNKIDEIIHDKQLISKLEAGARVIELGCGAASPIKTMATRFPNSSFVASELSETILLKARDNCKGLTNVTFAVVDACNVPTNMYDEFDLVLLFDVFHDVAYPDRLLTGACKLLKTGGQFMMNEINMLDTVKDNKVKCGQQGSLMYMISTFYCLPTSVRHPGGAGLGACAGPKVFEGLLRQSGLGQISKRCDDMIGLTFLATKTEELDKNELQAKKPKTV